MHAVGFIFELKNKTLILSGIPTECQEENLQIVIEDLIEQAKHSKKIQTNQKDNLAKSLATSLAIKETKKLQEEEMEVLRKELLNCELPSVCPSGKRTMINLKTNDLKKYF
mgnify:FL=1